MSLTQLPVRFLAMSRPASPTRSRGCSACWSWCWPCTWPCSSASTLSKVARHPADDRPGLGFYGLLTVGVGVLIVSGGIDLSIGSVVGLGAVCFGLLVERQVSPWVAALVVLAGSAVIGLAHGLLVTQLRLQPFLVTLCGLFIYRGVGKWLAPDHSPGLNVADTPEAFQRQVESFKWLLVGDVFGVPQPAALAAGGRRPAGPVPARHAARPLPVRHRRQRGGGPLRRHPDGSLQGAGLRHLLRPGRPG